MNVIQLALQDKTRSFESDYDLPESVRRLGALVHKDRLFIMKEGVYGHVSEKRVALYRITPLMRNSFKPHFYGHFNNENGIEVLRGRFAMHAFTRLFITFWMCSNLAFVVIDRSS